jgi:xylulokinase
MSYLLGIDVGTSSLKTALFDAESAQVVAVAAEEYPVEQPAPNMAEQSPERWWRAVLNTAQRVLQGVDRSRVRAIGLTGQMHGTLLLDAAAQPLRPAIIWADGRSRAQVERLLATFSQAEWLQIAGTLPATGFMAATLLWLAEHEPEHLDRAKHVLLPKDYIRLKLSGTIGAEPSDAASTALFDIRAARWSERLITGLGLPHELFPPLYRSAEVVGTLRAEVAAQLGLPKSLPVVAGCADQAAQALANNVLRRGTASVTIGSGGQVFVPHLPDAQGNLAAEPSVHVFNHAVPQHWYVLGAILAAGLSLRWLRNLLGWSDDPSAYERLSAAAESVPPGADGLLFLPYLLGERTPYRDPQARGVFIGLRYQHGTAHMARAVMEGVAFALRQALEVSFALAGAAEQVILAGGGAQSALWRQIQADIYGIPLRPSLLQEQTCVGAALLAGVGCGVYADIAEACAAAVRLGALIAPDQTAQARYQARYEHFKALYRRLAQDMHQLAEESASL